MSTLMGDWLGRDLFDNLPDGIPPLEPEDDDETDEGSEFAANTATFAPEGFETDTSVGFFLLPENDQDLPGPDDPKHCTLVYLGHIGGDGAPSLGDYSSLLANVANIAAKSYSRVTVAVKAIEPLGDDGATVWMLDDEHPIWNMRDDLLEIDSEVNSLYVDSTFTKYDEFKPHVTVGYETEDAGTTLVSEDVEEAQQVTEITFDRLALWFGEQKIEFPLAETDARKADEG